ncbi:CvpA family protein [Parerythrobacter aurantius]|uniref:CvpA family protein n=1 Tax=Parerythrobacter aurantius TaxID=3127706 RepID=UPI0032466287
MTGFDIIVFAIVGVAAIGGFMRGFVQEVLSLATWILALFAIRNLHTPLYTAIEPYVPTQTGAAIIAFVLLLLIPYAGMKLIAGRAGDGVKASLLGPIDRVLGFGFGAIKGAIVAVFAFSVLVLGYDEIWGYQGRPTWIATARTYPVINAASEDLVPIIRERRAVLNAEKKRQDELLGL